MDLEAIRRSAENPVTADAVSSAAAAEDLAAAFVEDPIFHWFMREDAGRDLARRRFFRVLLKESALKTGAIERPAQGGAAAVWIRSEDLGPQPLIAELKALPMLVNATGWARFSRLLALRAVMDASHPMDRPHDYLWFLGVHPAAQGAGVGSRLLASRTRRLDAAGRHAYLETATPKNVPLYRRHGFEVIHEFTPKPDGPLIWGMWRKPQADPSSATGDA